MNSRDALLESGRRKLHSVLRRDWAVRVLDDARRCGWTVSEKLYDFAPSEQVTVDRDGWEEPQHYFGDRIEHARRAAAVAVYPELPTAVRAALGECP